MWDDDDDGDDDDDDGDGDGDADDDDDDDDDDEWGVTDGFWLLMGDYSCFNPDNWWLIVGFNHWSKQPNEVSTSK